LSSRCNVCFRPIADIGQIADLQAMRAAFLALVTITIAAWLLFSLQMVAVAVSLARLGGATRTTLPALVVGGVGILGSAFVGLSTHLKWSRPARLILELLLLAVALLFLTVVSASRAG
jgi:hypothetical protein